MVCGYRNWSQCIAGWSGWCWYPPQHDCVGPLQGRWLLHWPDIWLQWCVPTLTTPTRNVPALTLSQCTLAGPVYTGMPLEFHWLTQCTLGYHWATQRILAGYTGTPWKNLVETAPRWNATGETLMPLEKLQLLQPTLEHHWRDCDSPHTPRHIYLSMQSSIHASLKWQDGGTLVSKWTGLCIFSLYLEFTALQWMPVLLFTHVSTSILFCVCLWYEHHYSFCVFGVTSQMKSV